MTANKSEKVEFFRFFKEEPDVEKAKQPEQKAEKLQKLKEFAIAPRSRLDLVHHRGRSHFPVRVPARVVLYLIVKATLHYGYITKEEAKAVKDLCP